MRSKLFAALALGAGLLFVQGTSHAAISQVSTQKIQDHFQNQIRHELITLPYLGVFDNLAFSVDGSTVTLYGQVTRPVLKSDAEHALRHIEGITNIVNRIEVLPPSSIDDQIRFAEYRAIFGYSNLSRYSWGPVPPVHIIVKNGHVSLEGTVATQADSNVANIRANGVSGVFSVENHLQIDRRS